MQGVKWLDSSDVALAIKQAKPLAGEGVRIEKTKRSKNDQKPARNGKKTKSQEQDKEFSQKSQPDQPDTVKLSQRKKQRSQRPKSEVKGPLLTSLQRLKGLFEVLKDQGPKLLKEQSVFIKKKREEFNTRAE
ncbi:hypothetical protein Tco_1449711 [Tanacetum coccineum]